jgi:hypothetical protein
MVYLKNSKTGAEFGFESDEKAEAFLDRVAADASEWDPCDDPGEDAVPFPGEL